LTYTLILALALTLIYTLTLTLMYTLALTLTMILCSSDILLPSVCYSNLNVSLITRINIKIDDLVINSVR
jgi:hypothetical protein